MLGCPERPADDDAIGLFDQVGYALDGFVGQSGGLANHVGVHVLQVLDYFFLAGGVLVQEFVVEGVALDELLVYGLEERQVAI